MQRISGLRRMELITSLAIADSLSLALGGREPESKSHHEEIRILCSLMVKSSVSCR